MKNLDKAKQQIDLYIKEMMWAKNKDSYAFMLGMIKIYNMMVSEGYQYTSIPEPLSNKNNKVKSFYPLKN